eukprot:TRINITY_DN19869_c0_g1_i1.p1 TRINITY_DN19869_c0_g1~~TRINITY_DN19869_c0_g1_i1.p1  ORF type:complete len:293 (+),score=27.89 TRINITY_DN19869_c0_g1_i1:45-881(+)
MQTVCRIVDLKTQNFSRQRRKINCSSGFNQIYNKTSWKSQTHNNDKFNTKKKLIIAEKQKIDDQEVNDNNQSNRRETILYGINFGLVLNSIATNNDATTIVNSVLSGYFLPTFGMTAGFKVYDDFDNDYVFEYPKAWVARANSLRDGIYVSNFQTADKATVDIFPVGQSDLEEDDLSEIVVQKIVSPTSGQQDDKLNMPSRKLIRTKTENLEQQEYLYLQFPSETITRSGYQVRRKNFAVATIKRGKIYCLNASARTDQFNKEKEELLRHIIESFRIR